MKKVQSQNSKHSFGGGYFYSNNIDKDEEILDTNNSEFYSNETNNKTSYEQKENNEDYNKLNIIEKIKYFFTRNFNNKFKNLNIKYKKDPKKAFVVIIAILGLFSMLIGSSYAYLTYISKTNNSVVIKAGTLALNFKNQSNSITLNNALPISDSEGLSGTNEYEFTVENTGTINANYKITLDNTCSLDKTFTVNGENIKPDKCIPNKYIKVALKEGNKSYEVLEYDKNNNEDYIIETNTINSSSSKTYKMKIWLDYDTPNTYNSKGNLNIMYSSKLNISYEQGNDTNIFNYTGMEQEYTVDKNGYYYVELAGASGGGEHGGSGAITSGYINLKQNEKLYFYVGEKGNTGIDAEAAYNGGGVGGNAFGTTISGTGGGATDVRLVGGSWDDTKSLISRIMVAGAGGGFTSGSLIGGNGGTLYGENGEMTNEISKYSTFGKAGTQISGGVAGEINGSWIGSTSGTFGKGGAGTTRYGGGGGSGYYGGGGAGVSPYNFGTGGGGSSYISGYAGVNSVKEITTITHTNQTLHYSGKYFIGAQVLEGKNNGDGYAKIKYVGVKPKRIIKTLDNVKYIKNCISYNTTNNENHWLEVEAIKDGVNIAKGKTVTGTTPELSTHPYSRVTDGDITSESYSTSQTYTTNQCITVNLEQTYDLDEIAIWNNLEDFRSYYKNKTYVSNNNTNWTEIINDASIETSNGHRINAYTDNYNGYIANNLYMWYDGYANTGTTKNHSTKTWKNLSNNNYNGIITGGKWNKNSLSLAGDNNTVDTGIDTSKDFTSTKDSTLSLTFKINEIPYNGTNGNIGMFFGASNRAGLGLYWIRNQAINSFSINGGTRANELAKVDTLHRSYPTKIYTVDYINDYSNNLVKLYIDGKEIGSSVATSGNYAYDIGNIGINKPQVMGGPETGSYANIDVYSAKVYDKALTKEEITHNYNYDKQRFNLD